MRYVDRGSLHLCALLACTLTACPKSDTDGRDARASRSDARPDAGRSKVDVRPDARPDQGFGVADARKNPPTDAAPARDAQADRGALADGRAGDVGADASTGGGCVLLDEVAPGSLASWSGGDSGNNPVVTWTEKPVGYQGSTAISATCVGTTTAYCESENIFKDFVVGTQSSSTAALRLYFKATSSKSYYNATFIYVWLLGAESETPLGHAGYYLEEGVGDHPVKTVPASYHLMEPTTTADVYRLPLSHAGAAVSFSKLRVFFFSYACAGENTSVLDHLALCPTS